MLSSKNISVFVFHGFLVPGVYCLSRLQPAFADNLKRKANGDILASISVLTKNDISGLKSDIPWQQRNCVIQQISEFKEFGMDSALIRIPADRPGIEFEPRGDGVIQVIFGRFTEDNYDYSGELTSSIDYSDANY